MTWEVTVTRDGESVVTIGSNHLAGRELTADDERAVETAAQHLLSFIGKSAALPPEGWQQVVDEMERYNDNHAFRYWAKRLRLAAPSSAPAPSLPPPQPEKEDDEPLHTGDDERLDLVTDIRASAEEIEGNEETTDAAASIIDSCHKLDALLLATIKRERESAPSLPPEPAGEPLLIDGWTPRYILDEAISMVSQAGNQELANRLGELHNSIEGKTLWPSLPPEGWQLIESAPQNERLLVTDGSIVWIGEFVGRWLHDEHEPTQTPTHWMPLPVPCSLSHSRRRCVKFIRLSHAGQWTSDVCATCGRKESEHGLAAPSSAPAPSLPPPQPEKEDDEPLHTGDDERLDLVTDIRASAEEIEGNEETTDAAASIIDSCHKLDALLLATIKRERESAPSLPPEPAGEPLLIDGWTPRYILDEAISMVSQAGNQELANRLGELHNSIEGKTLWPSLPPEGWQLIESAPQNERLLVTDGSIVWIGEFVGRWLHDEHEPTQTPTHWMPLPVPCSLSHSRRRCVKFIRLSHAGQWTSDVCATCGRKESEHGLAAPSSAPAPSLPPPQPEKEKS